LRPCIESRHAYQALKSLATHKTDRNDARGFTAALGIPTLDGLGANGKGAHAAYEQIYFSSRLAGHLRSLCHHQRPHHPRAGEDRLRQHRDFIAVEEGVGAIVDFGTATREQMASLKSVELDERPAARGALASKVTAAPLSHHCRFLMCPARRRLGVKRGKPNGSLGRDVPDKEALDWLSRAS